MRHLELPTRYLAFLLVLLPAAGVLSACSDKASPQDNSGEGSGGTASPADNTDPSSGGEPGSNGGTSSMGGSTTPGGVSSMGGVAGGGVTPGSGGATGGTTANSGTCTGSPTASCEQFAELGPEACLEVTGCSSDPVESCFALPTPNCWAEFQTPQACNASFGCNWLDNPPFACTNVERDADVDCFGMHPDEESCISDGRCLWTNEPYCGWARRPLCDRGDIVDCFDAPGCEWGFPCTGTPTWSCEERTTETTCKLIPGCSWN